MRTIELRFLDTKPSVRTGVTQGVPVPPGELQAADAAHLRRADGGAPRRIAESTDHHPPSGAGG
jgi:hypothetical protein